MTTAIMLITTTVMARKRIEKMGRHVVYALGRGAWFVATLFLAIAAIGVQADREALRHKALAAVIPSIFQNFSLDTLARAAYSTGRNKDGLQYARKLVIAQPVPAENLGLLTNGLLLTRENDKAVKALLLSAERGWRDRYTQLLLIAAAQQAGDFKVAAQRLIALWREGDQNQQTKDLTQELILNKNGLHEFSGLFISYDTNWATPFIAWAATKLPPEAIRQLNRSIVNAKIHVDCKKLALPASALVRSGKGKSAITLWLDLCNSESSTPSDFHFRNQDDILGPFDWHFPESSGLDVRLIENNASPMLQFNNTDQHRAVISRRNAVLDSGTYASSIELKGVRRPESRPIILQVSCYSDSGLASYVSRTEIKSTRSLFVIPNNNCISQDIALLAGRGDGTIKNMSITKL